MVELPTPASLASMGSRSAGVDNSWWILSIKKSERAKHLNFICPVGKILPLPARMLSIAAENPLEICRYR